MNPVSNENKPLLLIFPFNVLAHYLRCLKLAHYLSGHFTVQFLYSAKYASFIEEEGYATFECNTIDADKVQEGVRRFNFSWMDTAALEPVYNHQVRVITVMRPVAVLGDFTPTLKMAAESCGVLYFSLMNGYLSPYYAYVRKMPRRYPLYALFNTLPPPVMDYFTRIGESIYFKDIHQPFKRLRNRYHLSAQHSYADELTGDINLLCDLPELFPQKKLPSNYFFIPPLCYDKGGSAAPVIKQLDTAKKTIFVSMGSTGDWNNAAFLNHPSFEKYNIVTAGDYEAVVAAPHIIRTSFMNVTELFSQTNLIICHGGNGTIYQALTQGIPILCRAAQFEQEWNVDALEREGLGKSLDDISKTEHILLLIEEWIEKKNSTRFLYFKQKIWEANSRFEALLNNALQHSSSFLQQKRA